MNGDLGNQAGSRAFEYLAGNRRYVVGRDDEGYGVWPAGEETDEALERFPDDDAGSEAAFDRFVVLTRRGRIPRVLSVLFVVAVIDGLIWCLIGAYQTWRSVEGFDFASEGERSFSRVLDTLSTLAYPVFVVSVGMFILLWLWSRDAPRPDDRPSASVL
jgi:hypothetical protein